MTVPLWVRAWLRVEVVLGIFLMVLALFQTGQVAGAMASNSLSTDEFGTIGTFSGKGPVRVITDYRAPKNHIFYNLLNSVLPGRESFHPPRARALSILATAAIPIVMLLLAMALGRYLEAGVFLAFWAFAPQMLTLSMEARGYGFTAFFALVGSIATLAYFHGGHRFWLGLAALSTVLGTYTVPTYLLFGGPLLFLIAATTRRREAWVAGALAAAITLLLHAHVLTQIGPAFRETSVDAENDFVSLLAGLRVLQLYLFAASAPATIAFVAALVLTPFALLVVRFRDPSSRALAVITASSIAAFALLLLVQSPPVRVAAFLTVPLAFAGIFAAGIVLRELAPFPLRALVVGALGVSLVATSVPALRALNFVPTEDWTRAGNWIDAALPPNVKVDFEDRAKYLKQTLTDSAERTTPFDEAAFRSGDLVVASAPNKWADELPFTRPNEPRLAVVTVPGQIRDISLTFLLPTDHRIANLPPELTDGSTTTGLPPTDLTFTATDGRALVILFDRPVRQRFAVAHVRDAKTGDPLAEDPGVVHAGNSIAIPIPPDQTLEVDFTLHDPTAKIVEAWVTPTE